MARLEPDPDLEARFLAIVTEAGAIALRYFRPDHQTGAEVTWKKDGSPVTEADFAVNAYLETHLRALWPDAAWLSEESADDLSRLEAERVIIVDPIDGTRGFARGDTRWCIAVALVEAGRPILAIVHAPAREETFTAALGQGARRNGVPIAVSKADQLTSALRVSAPMQITKAIQEAGVEFDFRPKIASLALRITGVAAGEHDCCLTSANSNDWDLAAADLVLHEAGGILAGADGLPLVYNQAETIHGALTATARAMQPKLRDAVARARNQRR